MGSSKGEPDNPKLREQVKEEVKNLDKGGGKGSWSAWKAGELARRYEAKGGGYKDNGDNKNKAKKGVPEPKDGSEWGGKGVSKKEKEEGKGQAGGSKKTKDDKKDTKKDKKDKKDKNDDEDE